MFFKIASSPHEKLPDSTTSGLSKMKKKERKVVDTIIYKDEMVTYSLMDHVEHYLDPILRNS